MTITHFTSDHSQSVIKEEASSISKIATRICD